MIIGMYGHALPDRSFVNLPAEDIDIAHVYLSDEQARSIAWQVHVQGIPLVVSPGEQVLADDADFYTCTFASAVVTENEEQLGSVGKLHVRSREDCYAVNETEDLMAVYEKVLAQKDIPVQAVHVKKDMVSLELAKEKVDVSLDDYLRFQIGQREVLSEPLFHFLKEEEKYSQCYARSLKKLAANDHTAWEIRQDIMNHDGTPEMAARIIGKLTDAGLLDDERYCREKISSLQASGYGRKYILDYLQRKGVFPKVSGKIYDILPDREEENLTRFMNKQKNGHKNASLSARKKAVYAACVRRGFDPELVNRVMGQTEFADEKEDQRLEQCVQKAVRKYGRNRNQVFRYCYAHGFVSTDIQDVMSRMEWNIHDED